MAKKGYYFVTKNSKKNLIIMLVVLVFFCVLLAVISLIPSRFKDTWLNTDNGTARSVMYPFVYTSDDSLYVLTEDSENISVDNSVSSCIHDVNYNLVYYLREGKLYEYDIDTNRRVLLSDGVASFRLFPERTAVLCTNNSNDIYLYLYKNKGSIKLNKSSLMNINSDSFYKLGKECFLFLDNFETEKNTASLMCSDLKGEVKLLAKDIDASKGFNISDDDSYVSYYKGDSLYVSDTNGKTIKNFKNAKHIIQNSQPVITEACTEAVNYSNGISFMYLLTEISETGSSGELTYFEKNGIEVIDKNVRSVIYFNESEKFVLYTKSEADGYVSLYKCQKNGKPSKVITCALDNKFFFNKNSTFLYIQSSKGFLRRVNVFDKSFKVTDVSEGSGVLFDYEGKSFAGYHNLEGDSQYLILDNDKIEKYSMNEVRYYGKFTSRYLLLRDNGHGKFSLDYTKDGYTTRIADGIEKNIFFDKEFDNIIFSKNGKLCVFKDGVVSEVSETSVINSVSVISAK